MKRDTYITGPSHRPPRSAIVDAADFLRLAAKWFLDDRECAAHVDEAVANWLQVRAATHVEEQLEPRQPTSAEDGTNPPSHPPRGTP